MQSKNTVWIVAIVMAVLIACCCLIIACVALGFGFYRIGSSSTGVPSFPQITLIPSFDPDVEETPVELDPIR